MDSIKSFMKVELNLDDFKSDNQKNAVQEIFSKLDLDKKNFVLSMATQAGKSLIYQVLG